MDDDFERRRELRRQKREEMRLEAERMAYRRNDEDEEEAARERRRRARQERLRGKEVEDTANPVESVELNNTHSVSASTVSSAPPGPAEDVQEEEERALLERLAKREERRQRRMQEALDRQKQEEEESSATSRSLLHQRPSNSRKEEEEEEEEEAAPEEEQEPREAEDQQEEEEVEEPRSSYLRERESIVEEKAQAEDKSGDAVCPSQTLQTLNEEVGDSAAVSQAEKEVESARVDEHVEGVEESELDSLKQNTADENTDTADSDRTDREVAEILDLADDEDVGRKSKQQNGGVYEDSKHKKAERTLSRGSLRSPENEEADVEAARLEAERKLEELKRRRDETESEEFERMRLKQQEAEAELEELRRKREERRKVLEEEERHKKQEEADRKSREEEEKRRMREEIERRRAEAAERRQKVGEEVDGDPNKPFKCVSPRGSSLKIGERAEFLNKSAQKSAVKMSHTPVVSKIDNRLEQYTSAVQSNKDARSPRPAAIDLPMVSDGVRSIKSMWEKGNVFSSSTGSPSSNKDAAGIKVGVAGRINDWLNKTPEAGKTLGGRPSDLKPGDVTSKRNLWENKGSSAAKVTSRGESKSFANGTGH